MPYFHHLRDSLEPGRLLDPDGQVSTPWGEPDHGPCDKCGGSGQTEFRCLSCIEEGTRRDCPACDGRVEYLATCPACGGDGVVTRTHRRGVSVFPGLGGLYRYLVERQTEFEGTRIVELEGELSDVPDLDADCGALLVCPTEIVAVHDADLERVTELRARLE
jgi:hypothetical protein